MTAMVTHQVPHEHVWQEFAGGDGCTLCPAWRFPTAPITLIDELPTSLLEQPPRSDYGPRVADDLALDVMHDLIQIARSDVSWPELESIANVVIERVRSGS